MAEIFLVSEPFGIFIKILLCQLVGPMLQGLPDHRADSIVVPGTTSLRNFRDQIVLPPSLLSCTLGPSSYLSLVILSSSSLIEPAVPLEPPIRILRLLYIALFYYNYYCNLLVHPP